MAARERLRGEQLRLERRHHRVGDLILDREDVLVVAVVGLRPEVIAVVGSDQLRGDADALARAAHAPLEQVRHPQLLGDGRDVVAAALEVEGRGARRHPQVRHLREQVEQLLGETVGEVLLVPVLAHVGEGQHRDGFLWNRLRAGRDRSGAPRLAATPLRGDRPPRGVVHDDGHDGHQREPPDERTERATGGWCTSRRGYAQTLRHGDRIRRLGRPRRGQQPPHPLDEGRRRLPRR